MSEKINPTPQLQAIAESLRTIVKESQAGKTTLTRTETRELYETQIRIESLLGSLHSRQTIGDMEKAGEIPTATR